MRNTDDVRTLADEHHLEFVDLDRFNVDASVCSVIPLAVARRHHVVPIGRKFGAPVVAMSNPSDVMAMDVLHAVIGREFVAVVATDDQIETCLGHVYGAPGGGTRHKNPPAQPDAPSTPSPRQGAASAPPAAPAAEPPAPVRAVAPAPPRPAPAEQAPGPVPPAPTPAAAAPVVAPPVAPPAVAPSNGSTPAGAPASAPEVAPTGSGAPSTPAPTAAPDAVPTATKGASRGR